jgi:xanthine dehydrogenase accessory factor
MAMGFDLKTLHECVVAHGRVARVVITGTKGSTPRDEGASMLVWTDGQSGTIGGGTLEYQAVTTARKMLVRDGEWLRQTRNVPLGPALGQCCGGSVSLLSEVFGAVEIDWLTKPLNQFSRSVLSGMPPVEGISQKAGIYSEEMTGAGQPLWIYGAGHVGRALVHALLPLDFAITWVDTDPARYPETLPVGVTQLVSQNPADVVRYAPKNARHLVLTYSHALDLELCHQILSHSFEFAGLIGSATKWARFQKRLGNLGHSPAQIARITCPIGLPELGKDPAAIALGVASEMLRLTKVDALSTGHAKEHAL